jgi:poly(A) polymerase
MSTLEKAATEIVKKLTQAGFTAYFAGGAVRDMLLGINPTDIDIATDAKPEEVQKLFKKTVSVGKKFGVIKVFYKGHWFEVATFRVEGPYKDGRRPSFVKFTDAEQDARRRDFTINGLFYDPIGKKVIDYVDGQKDLKGRVLRFIGDPGDRIREDHLRLLRAIRFKNRFGLRMDKKTWEAIKNHAALIKKVSPERIRDELDKMLAHESRVQALGNLEASGLLKEILPEVTILKTVRQTPPYHKEGSVWTHTLMALEVLEPHDPLEAIWATLLHDTGKAQTKTLGKDKIAHFFGHSKESANIAKRILRRLRCPTKFIDEVVWAIQHHLVLLHDLEKMREARWRRLFADPRFPTLFLLFKADALGKKPPADDRYEKVARMYETEKHHPIPEKPILSGSEIMRVLKLKSGPKVGELKEKVQDAFLEGRVKTKQEALAYLRKLS